MRFVEALDAAWDLLEQNPWAMTPIPNMAAKRRALQGKPPKESRKPGRRKIARPRTQRKRKVSVVQHAVQKLQKARQTKNARGFRYWSKFRARHMKHI